MADRPSAKLLTGLLVVSSAAVSLRGTQVVVATLDKDCRNQTVALKIPVLGSMSEMAILRQLAALFLKPNTNFNILASLDFKASFNSRAIHFEVTASIRECVVAVLPRWEWRDQNASFIRNAEALDLVFPACQPNDNAGFVMSFSAITDGDRLNVDESKQDVHLKM